MSLLHILLHIDHSLTAIHPSIHPSVSSYFDSNLTLINYQLYLSSTLIPPPPPPPPPLHHDTMTTRLGQLLDHLVSKPTAALESNMSAGACFTHTGERGVYARCSPHHLCLDTWSTVPLAPPDRSVFFSLPIIPKLNTGSSYSLCV